MRVVLGVHENAAQPALLREPRDRGHVRREVRPGGIVRPGEALHRRPPRTDEALAQGGVLDNVLEDGDLVFQPVARPGRIVHDPRMADRAPVGQRGVDHQRHAVEPRLVEGVRMREHLPRRHAEQIPAMTDVFFLHRRKRRRRETRVGKSRSHDHRQNMCLHALIIAHRERKRQCPRVSARPASGRPSPRAAGVRP